MTTPPDAAEYEQTFVHDVYEQISSHFSQTRHKPWPVVDKFLRSRPPGSIGIDVGCGNGKYLTVNKDIFIIASDRSPSLIDIAAQHQPHSATVADTLTLPHQNERFDFGISIAVIHHLSSRDRRVEAIKEIVRVLKKPYGGSGAGQALLFVWALEQKNSRRGWDRGDDQDVLVPWVLKQQAFGGESKTFQRYYHLYEHGEIEKEAESAGANAVESGYDRDNWWVVIEPKS